MAEKDKALLMKKVEGTLKPRMFANLLEEAVDEIQDHLDEFDINHVVSDDGSVLESNDCLETFINAKRVGGRSEKTLVRYRYIIERFMDYVKVKTNDVTTYHVRDYFSAEQQRGVSESTIEGLREVLNGYFGWLEHEKLIRKNPVFNIERIKYQKKERLAFSYTDIDLLQKNSYDNIRDNAIISVLLASGCRISEIVNLNRDDVDLANGEFIVLGKGNKERTVFLDDVAIMTLKEYLLSRSDNCNALFVNRYCKRLQPGGVRAMLKKVSEKANIENVHPHRFRRTMITRLLNRGMPIQEVAILVGHDKIDTTMKYFSSNKGRIKNSYKLYTT